MIDLDGAEHESAVFDALVSAARDAGVATNRCEITVRTVLESLTAHLAPAARDVFLAKLPIDARALALPPVRRRHARHAGTRDTLDLVKMAADLHDDDAAQRVVNGVLAVVEAR